MWDWGSAAGGGGRPADEVRRRCHEIRFRENEQQRETITGGRRLFGIESRNNGIKEKERV